MPTQDLRRSDQFEIPDAGWPGCSVYAAGEAAVRSMARSFSATYCRGVGRPACAHSGWSLANVDEIAETALFLGSVPHVRPIWSPASTALPMLLTLSISAWTHLRVEASIKPRRVCRVVWN